MKYYVYFLQSLKNNKYYIGVTDNVKRRLYEHNQGLSKYTRSLRPLELKRVERFKSINEAYAREKFIKNKKSRKIIELIIKSSPDVLAPQEHRDSVG